MSFYDFTDLVASFPVEETVNVKVKEADQTVTKLLQTYKDGYERFWQTPLTHGNRALTSDDLNAMFAAAPAIMTEIQNDGTAFVNFVQTAHPEIIGTDLFPTRFLTIPYEQDATGALTTLKPEWEAPVEEELV
jgi:hypothetical protein